MATKKELVRKTSRHTHTTDVAQEKNGNSAAWERDLSNSPVIVIAVYIGKPSSEG